MTQPKQPSILFIGKDPSLEYLLKRYARQSGHDIQSVQDVSPEVDLPDQHPVAVWFSSLEALETWQWLRAAIARQDIPIVVCSSVADEVRAGELGADYFFLHPLTYDSFLTTLAVTDSSQTEKE